MINKVILMGRMTKDPELRTTNAGKSVCSFTLAVDDGYGDNKRTYFINCVAWEKTAEFLKNWFGKGRMCIVIGKIGTRTWESEDGKKHYATEVVAHEVKFGESKGATEQAAPKPSGEAFTPLIGNDEDLPF